jgi:hypothetical protein
MDCFEAKDVAGGEEGVVVVQRIQRLSTRTRRRVRFEGGPPEGWSGAIGPPCGEIVRRRQLDALREITEHDFTMYITSVQPAPVQHADRCYAYKDISMLWRAGSEFLIYPLCGPLTAHSHRYQSPFPTHTRR